MLKLKGKNRLSGFTLVELLVGVAIIGVLATVGVPTFKKMIQRSKKSEAKVNLGGIYTAEQAFMAEYGAFGNNIASVGFESVGDAMMYRVGFGLDNAGCVGVAAIVPNLSDTFGQSINRAFPSYYSGTPLYSGAYTTLNVCKNGLTLAAFNMSTDTTAPSNNVYNSTGTSNYDRFVAMAQGVIAPGIRKDSPPNNTYLDVWGINSARTLINLQDGVK